MIRRIPPEDLDKMHQELIAAVPNHIFTLQLVFDSFREHQKLVEKFKPVTEVILVGHIPRGRYCVYCREINQEHLVDCPYVIREKMGYVNEGD